MWQIDSLKAEELRNCRRPSPSRPIPPNVRFLAEPERQRLATATCYMASRMSAFRGSLTDLNGRLEAHSTFNPNRRLSMLAMDDRDGYAQPADRALEKGQRSAVGFC
jgi:hypothetical protein